MRSIRRILVAIKHPADKTLPGVAKAAQLALAMNAELVLFQAICAPLYVDGHSSIVGNGLADAERSIRAAALLELNSVAARLRRKGIRVAAAVEWDYPIHEATIRETKRVGADLIVAERHAGRHIAPSLLHPTDWELLRLSPVPVLLVKRASPYRRPVVLAAIDPDHTYSKPAHLDSEILRASKTVAAALRGSLHAIHAYASLPAAALCSGPLSEESVARMQADSAAAASRKVERAVRSVDVPKARRHLVARHPADAIVETAADTRAALVVMGAVARSGLKRLVIGNTAEKVLYPLACDVLIVKPRRVSDRVRSTRRGVQYVSVAASPPGVTF